MMRNRNFRILASNIGGELNRRYGPSTTKRNEDSYNLNDSESYMVPPIEYLTKKIKAGHERSNSLSLLGHPKHSKTIPSKANSFSNLAQHQSQNSALKRASLAKLNWVDEDTQNAKILPELYPSQTPSMPSHTT
mmetsp:Transcript_24930/g.24674  ORF Transcript_24930/g.24674 Transcript_24930/m.24674 type:complete len:134 (-) Transcript_24930:13-414(-)